MSHLKVVIPMGMSIPTSSLAVMMIEKFFRCFANSKSKARSRDHCKIFLCFKERDASDSGASLLLDASFRFCDTRKNCTTFLAFVARHAYAHCLHSRRECSSAFFILARRPISWYRRSSKTGCSFPSASKRLSVRYLIRSSSSMISWADSFGS